MRGALVLFLRERCIPFLLETLPYTAIEGVLLAVIAPESRSYHFYITWLLASPLQLIGVRTLDDISDRKRDLLRHPERPLPRGAVSLRSCILLFLFCLLAPPVFFSINFGPLGLCTAFPLAYLSAIVTPLQREEEWIAFQIGVKSLFAPLRFIAFALSVRGMMGLGRAIFTASAGLYGLVLAASFYRRVYMTTHRYRS